MTPEIAALLIVQSFMFLGLVVRGVFDYIAGKDANKQRVELTNKVDAAATAATANEKLTVQVAADLKENTATTQAVHGLVNGRMTAQLARFAQLSREHARVTGRESDAQMAEEAERVLAEHIARQPK